jgi:hypothetical protein
MIVNIRGTSGSGKSTLAKLAIEHFLCLPKHNEKGRVTEYLDVNRHLLVLGSYETECGGCDTIKTQDEIVTRVVVGERLAKNLLFEGALVSTIAQRYLDLAALYPGRFIFAIMDTPLDLCLERVMERRARRGDERKLNPFRTVEKHNATKRFVNTVEAANAGGAQYDLRWIDHTKPLESLLRMLTP